MKKYKYFFIALLLIFIPLYPKFPLVGVSETFVSIRLEDLIIAVIVGIYGIDLFKNRFAVLKKPIPRSILLYWLIGFTATFSGIFLTKTTSLNLGALHFFRHVEYMCLFFIAFDWLENRDQLKFLTKIIILVSILVAFYGLGQQYFHFPVISTTNSEFSKGLALSLGAGARINSTFAGAYDLAAFMVLPLIFIIALIPISKNKILLLTAALLIYSTILLSASRIPFASLFIGTGMLVILMRKKLWLAPLLIAAVLGFFLTPQLRGRYLELLTHHLKLSWVPVVYAQTEATPASRAVDNVPDALKPPAVPEDRSFNIRLQAEWPMAVRTFSKNPALGLGFSSIGLAVDNDYLRILAETGVLGLLAFGLIHIRFYKYFFPAVFKKSDPTFESTFILAAGCSLFSFLIGAMFIDYFEASKIAMIIWIIIGLAEKAKTFSKTNADKIN